MRQTLRRQLHIVKCTTHVPAHFHIRHAYHLEPCVLNVLPRVELDAIFQVCVRSTLSEVGHRWVGERWGGRGGVVGLALGLKRGLFRDYEYVSMLAIHLIRCKAVSAEIHGNLNANIPGSKAWRTGKVIRDRLLCDIGATRRVETDVPLEPMADLATHLVVPFQKIGVGHYDRVQSVRVL